ncbi:class I SAM-dependent methyltransferase [Sphingobium sp. YC-XJ3]|uniref:class I SAM-dependent methyltransferase n=1 Tax=Sphingobium sp. YC-XJ3 TaxID=3024245 RepID=UPI00235F04A3|nr:hypothetical protein [Sphingobium sp. YC-XJ3]WDA37870.1 hypothetical protein PO876_06725 [Sphingobium sp. YC-XJ3]
MQALAESKQTRKINIGCGYDKRPGYLNVDMDPACQPDVLLADNDFSRFGNAAFDEVLAHDVLEHIPRSQTTSALLEWADILAMGGVLRFQTSSILGLADLLRSRHGWAEHDGLSSCLFGNQKHPGDFHYTGFTETTLSVHLLTAGFQPSTFDLVDGWMFSSTAPKVIDWSALSRRSDLTSKQFVAEACREALGREVEAPFLEQWAGFVESGSRSRRDILKMLYDSDERRWRIAVGAGLQDG